MLYTPHANPYFLMLCGYLFALNRTCKYARNALNANSK